MCVYTIVTYNKLVKLRSRVKNSWAQIDVQLKKRYDLIPNLVETVKGYAKHESDVLTQVTEARASVGRANTTEEQIASNNELSGALSRLLVVAEKYPDLKANQNFISLQRQIEEIEHKIAMSRQFYNDTVMNFNQKTEMFPSNVIAKIFKFKAETYFEAETAAKDAPKVQF
ncbi:MAG: LemA family protein [Clostridia bacterium]